MQSGASPFIDQLESALPFSDRILTSPSVGRLNAIFAIVSGSVGATGRKSKLVKRPSSLARLSLSRQRRARVCRTDFRNWILSLAREAVSQPSCARIRSRPRGCGPCTPDPLRACPQRVINFALNPLRFCSPLSTAPAVCLLTAREHQSEKQVIRADNRETTERER